MNNLILPSHLSNIRNDNAPQIIVPRRSDEQEVDYNTINVLDSDETNKAKVEMWIAKNVAAMVERVYPLREWAVGVDVTGGMIVLKCEAVSLTHGYHIAMAGRNIQELGERAVQAAGEILERHNVTRDRKYNTDITEAMDRDAKGDMIGGDNG